MLHNPVDLVILAAGLSRRYGRLKQLDPLGPDGEAILDYTIEDALRAGVRRIVPVVREEIADAVETHVRARVRGRADVSAALQRTDDVPEGPTTARERPWGTGHAVLAARHALDSPFVVANADDLYGAATVARLVRFAQATAATAAMGAVAGYRLEETLSAEGGVSRAVCFADADGVVREVVELHDIRRVGGAIVARWPDGETRDVSADLPVSTNLWAFTPVVLRLLWREFGAFLEGAPAGDEEFLLSTAVGALVAGGALHVVVIAAQDRWSGVTHAGDADAVRHALAR